MDHRKRKFFRKKDLIGIGFLLPSFCGVLVFYLLPFADVLRRAFCTAVSGSFVGLENFKAVLRNEAFLLAAQNTLRFAALCLPLLLGLGLAIGVLLAKNKRLRSFQAVYLLPMAIPSATVVIVWQMLFDRYGLLNGLLTKLFGSAFGQTDYMNTDAAFWVLLASYIWKNLGYTVTLWLAGLLSVPKEYEEAARTDGASQGQIFKKIIFPQLLPVMYTITVLSFLNSFKVFREAYLVAGSYPHESMYLLQHLFNNWFVNLSLDKMAAAAVLTGLVMLAAVT